MIYSDLSRALSIADKNIQSRIDSLQDQLEAIPDTFYALFWLYTYDFLYISESIEKVLGHSYNKFTDHGMVFFQSIIPPHRISHIYKTMNAQASQIENHPDYIFGKEYLNVQAAIFNSKMQEVPVTYNALFLDVKPFVPTSYLVLCSWIDLRNKNDNVINEESRASKKLILEIKELYIKDKPEHFKALQYRNKISQREKEVALLLMQGHSTKSISEQLQITFNTVESHRKNLLVKLGAKNTAELIHKFNLIPF